MVLIKFRTFIVAFLIIQQCITIAVIFDNVASLMIGDHPSIYGTLDIYIFDIILSIIVISSSIISMITSSIFVFGYQKCSKSFVISAFAINCVVFLPFYISGFYLYPHLLGSLETSDYVKNQFEYVIHKARNPLNETITLKNNSVNFVNTVQKRYCCCGLSGPTDYNSTAILKHVLRFPISDSANISCPSAELDKTSTCHRIRFDGCEVDIKRVYPLRILVFSSIGFISTLLYIFLSPYIYSQVEFERRLARSVYIRNWRKELHLMISEQMKPLRMNSLNKSRSENQPMLEKPKAIRETKKSDSAIG